MSDNERDQRPIRFSDFFYTHTPFSFFSLSKVPTTTPEAVVVETKFLSREFTAELYQSDRTVKSRIRVGV